MAGNKIIEDKPGEGFDWRSDADAALGRHDPDRAERRGRGRPKGAQNRKTQDFATWYDAQGYKDPLQLMAEFITADPIGVQAFYIENERTQKAIGKQFGLAVPSLDDIRKAQFDAAAELAPYLHGKAPVRIEVVDERLPVLVINSGTNQLEQARLVHAKSLSVGRPLVELTANKINDLAETKSESPTAENPTKGKAQ
jgi:hypothetical protein